MDSPLPPRNKIKDCGDEFRVRADCKQKASSSSSPDTARITAATMENVVKSREPRANNGMFGKHCQRSGYDWR